VGSASTSSTVRTLRFGELTIDLAAHEVALFVYKSAGTHALRAGTSPPPTQEMMAPYGITARMHEHGLQVRRWQIRSRRGALVAEFDLGLLKDVTPYPYRLHLEQHRLTPIQLDCLRKEPKAEVHFGHRITGFQNKKRSVLVNFAKTQFTGLLPDAVKQAIAARLDSGSFFLAEPRLTGWLVRFS